MIIDTFIFFNELDLLEIRLHELSGVVDRFVLVEATKTFSGEPKTLYYKQNRERFAEFNDRITHIIVDDMPASGDAWGREYHQRNAIVRGLTSCSPDDLILISDADEIPRAETLAKVRGGINVFSQMSCYYYFNMLCENAPTFQMGRAVRFAELTSPQKIREAHGHVIEKGGWHFSYLGGVESIRNKIRSFAHQEYNNELYLDLDYIDECIEKGRDFLGRDYKWKTIEVDDAFPDYVLKNRLKFSKYIKTPRGHRPSSKVSSLVPRDKYFEMIHSAQRQIDELRIEVVLSGGDNVKRLQEDIKQLSAWGKNQEEAIVDRDFLIRELQREVEKLGNWGQAEEKVIRERDQLVTKLNQTMLEKDLAISEANERAGENKDQVENLGRTVEERERTLGEMGGRIKELEGDVQKLAARGRGQENVIRERDELAANLNLTLAEKERAISELNRRATEGEEQVERLKEKVRDLTERKQSLRKVFGERGVLVDQLGLAVAENDKTMVQMGNRIRALDGDVQKLAAWGRAEEEVIRERDRLISTLVAELEKVRAELMRVTCSRRWKLARLVAGPTSAGIPLKKCLQLVSRFFHVLSDSGPKAAGERALLWLKMKRRRSPLSPSPEHLEISPSGPAAESLGYVGALADIFRKLKFDVDVEKAAESLQTHLSAVELQCLQKHIFLLQDYFLKSSASSRELITASDLPSGSSRRERNILFVTSLFPNPHHGGGGRVMDFIKILSEKNKVYLYTTYNPSEDGQAYREVLGFCAGVKRVFFSDPAPTSNSIREWLKDTPIDVVHYEWPESLTYYDPSLGKSQIFTYMESVSLRLSMDMENMEPLSASWVEKFGQLMYHLKVELVDASKLDLRVAVTQKDANYFRTLSPGMEFAVANHGVSMDEFCLPDVDPEPGALAFVGNYRHPPNEDAVRFFFNSIWGDVIKEVPDAKIYIIGAHPPDWFYKLSKEYNVIVTGMVPDIRPYIQKACVCVAPLVSGAGLRGKVLQYGFLRRSFVATSIAVEGLALTDGRDFLLDDSATGFSKKIIKLLKDPAWAKDMGLKAYEKVSQNYDNRRLVDFLERIYDRLDEQASV